MHKHLAILSKPGIERILSGQKTVETRFSKHKIPPFNEVHTGDIVYIKETGKDIVGQFTVKSVISFETLQEQDWEHIKKSYAKELSLGSEDLDDKFFKTHKTSNFGTVIFISKVEQLITSPVTFKKTDRRGWVVQE